jgi:cytochrome c-type biogenesis protein CcmH
MPRYLTILAAALLLLTAAVKAQEPLHFDSPEQEQRFNELTFQLRCLVCQNQNLADSDAPLAQDLRQEIWEMMHDGKNNEEIKQFLVERYGDFVLYQPPMQGNTVALWAIPVVLLFGGGLVVFFTVRNRNRKLAAQKAAAHSAGESD